MIRREGIDEAREEEGAERKEGHTAGKNPFSRILFEVSSTFPVRSRS